MSSSLDLPASKKVRVESKQAQIHPHGNKSEIGLNQMLRCRALGRCRRARKRAGIAPARKESASVMASGTRCPKSQWSLALVPEATSAASIAHSQSLLKA